MSTAINTHHPNYIASLTGLRGIAAILVFLHHYDALNPGIRLDLVVPVIGSMLQFPLGFGFTGVDVFFVLSGFLLGLPFARSALAGGPKIALGNYFKRRALRVFPAYYAQLVILLIFTTWFVTWKPQTITTLFAHLVMFFNIGPQPVTPIVGLWWTLPVEMSYYLLLPLLRPLMRPRLWLITLLIGISLSIVYRIWAATHFGALSPHHVVLAASQIPGTISEFLLGTSAAILVVKRNLSQKPRPPAWLLDLVFIGSAVLVYNWFIQVVFPNNVAFWLGHWSMIVNPLVVGLIFSSMVLSLYWGSRIGTWLLANRVVYFLGMISYSLYLWHFVVMQQLQLVAGDMYFAWPPIIRFLVSFIAVLCVSTASYFLVEKRFVRFRPFRELQKAPDRPA